MFVTLACGPAMALLTELQNTVAGRLTIDMPLLTELSRPLTGVKCPGRGCDSDSGGGASKIP